MFSKSILWSTTVVFAFFFITPYFFYWATASCFQEYIRIDISRPENDLHLGLLAFGVLLLSYAFVHIFHKWSGGIFSNKNGFIFGLWASLLVVVSMSLIRYATQNAFEAPIYILDGIYWTAMYAVGGVLVAIVSRKTS